jgi:hypothetical protein
LRGGTKLLKDNLLNGGVYILHRLWRNCSVVVSCYNGLKTVLEEGESCMSSQFFTGDMLMKQNRAGTNK